MTWLLNNAGLVGLLFFFTVFLIVMVDVFIPGRKHRFDAIARIPLEDKDD